MLYNYTIIEGVFLSDSLDPEFVKFRAEQLKDQASDENFLTLTSDWVNASVKTKYSYGFDWLGVPIIQFPSDLIAFQEIVFKVKPTLIIECGVARGGSAIFWASMQHLSGIKPNVIGVDIDIRDHAWKAIEGSPYREGIHLIVGDSTEKSTFEKVATLINSSDKIMVILDSNHTHEHVLKELEIYAELVTIGSYLLVLDTVIENIPKDATREWGPGANPQTAVLKYMSGRNSFKNDDSIEQRIGITVAPKGYWFRVQ